MDRCNDYPYLNTEGLERCFLLDGDFELEDLTSGTDFSFQILAQSPINEHVNENTVGTLDIKFSWLPKGGVERKQLLMERVVPMITAGSNAAPTQLKRKFQDWKSKARSTSFAPVLCIPIAMKGMCAAYSAHAAPYGAIPLTLAPSGDDSWSPMSVLFVAEELIPVMNRSESLGVNYCLAKWTDTSGGRAVKWDFDTSIPWAYSYLSRHGFLIDGDGKRPLIHAFGSPADATTLQFDTQVKLRAHLEAALLEDDRVRSLIEEYRSKEKSPSNEPPVSDTQAIETLLKKGAAVTAISNALKRRSRDEIHASMTIVAGSNGYAEFLQLADRRQATDLNVIPSGEKTFYLGQLTVFISTEGAKRMRHRPDGESSGSCVLMSFHPLARQEIAVLAHFKVLPYENDEVRIYGRDTAKRADCPSRDNSRLALLKGRHPDVALRDYDKDYEAGHICVAPQSVRGALGYAFDDADVMCQMAWVDVPPYKRRSDWLGRFILGWQESYARVAKLPIEDMEKSISRIQPSMMDILGVQPGYSIVVDSVVKYGDRYVLKTKRIKALTCSSEHMSERQKSPGYGDRLSSRYVRSQDVLGVPDAHPIIMLDRSIRTDLLQNDEDSSYPDEIPSAYLQAFRLRRSNLGLIQKELLVLAISLFGLWFGFASVLNQMTKEPIFSLVVGASLAGYVVLFLLAVRHSRRPVRFVDIEKY
ncbi:hypothetical protein [Roseateles sp. LYH14W]|uniref:Uncharacterized protein n=1 Tax=Pelomonas parva TaxID=3299032 RepID=A0ABW7F3J7_9BURK